MNANTGSVFQRIARNPRLYAVAVACVVVAALASAAFMRMPLLGHASDSPVTATAAPVPDSTIAPLLALDRATEAISERIMPSVVNIRVDGTNTVSRNMPGPDQIPAPFRQFFFQGPGQMQPRSQPFAAFGTGLIISPDGYIVTNNHVVNGATHVQVTLNDQRVLDAKVVGTDKATDLAVVKIDATGLTSAAFGDSSQLKPGETVLAFGDPLGMNFSVTRGIVSAVNRPRIGDGQNSRGSFIQTDAPINHGNSGGPLVNARGDVVGINTEMLSDSGVSAGIGFAIPSNLVKPTAESLIKNGKVLRGYLGIVVTDLTPAVADTLNESGTQGALINQVNDGSPAARAGLKPYDVVTAFDGHKISTGTDLQTIAGGTAPGATAHLDVMRNGKPLQVAVTLGNFDNATSTPVSANASEEGGSAGSGAKLGVSVAPLTDDLRGQLQLPDSVHGVVVQSVTPGGPAMIAGLQQGDVIEQVNQHAVTTVDELRHQLSLAPAGKDILLMVHNPNGDFILPVHPQQ